MSATTRDGLTEADLDPQQLAAFRQLKTTVDHKWTHLNKSQRAWLSDACLLRYLRARKFDVLAATNLLVDTLDYRIDVKPHKIKAEAILPFAKAMSKYFHMTDVAGHPVCYLRFNRDPPNFTAEERLRFIAFTMEEGIRLIKHNEARYPDIEKIIYIIDLADFSLGAPAADVGVSKAWGQLLSNHYPERLHRAYLLNYPSVFSTFWGLISVFMTATQLEKVRWVPKTASKAELREYFAGEGFEMDKFETDLGGDVPPLDAPNYLGDAYRGDFPMGRGGQ